MRPATEVADEIFACGPANGRDDSAWREVRAIVVADRLALVERLREMIDGEPVRVIYDAASKGMFHGLLDRIESEIRAAAEGGSDGE